MKKVVISASAVLFVLIIAISVYFIFIKDNSEQVDNIDTVITPTVSPTPTIAPTVTPQPEVTENTLYPVYQKVEDLIKYGYIDASGAYVIEPTYDYASDFMEGVAIVTLGEKYQVIDPTGAVIFENNNTINSFQNGAAAFLQSKEDMSLYGYINLEGQVIVEPQYTFAGNFNEAGQAYVVLPDGKTYELIDKTGQVLESYELDLGNSYIYSFEDGYVVYYNYDTSKYGASSVTGETIFEPQQSDLVYLGHDLFAVKDPALDSYAAMLDPAAIYNAKGEQLTDYNLYDLQHFNGEYSSAGDETSLFFIGFDGQTISSLPSYDGGGKLTLLGDIVKAEIDGGLTYYRLDNTILWQYDTSTYLAKGITVKDMKFKPLRTVMVHYPQIEGITDAAVQQQVNQQLEDLFTESRANITPEDNLSVDDNYTAALRNNLLLISMSGYDYYEGAAHGMPLREYYFIDVTNGEFFDLRDLFIKGSDYKTKINEIILAKITEDLATGESMFFEDSFTGISDAPYFFLDEDGITIYFYPYEISAYAGGFPEFDISFEELKDYINTDGDFWKAFH